MSFAAFNEYVALEIFQAFVAADRDGPYTLIQVSTMWRDMTFRSPTLWSYVYLDDSSPDWEQRLAVYQALSQERPLHVSLRIPFVNIDILKHFVSRWKSLEIHLSSDEDLSGISEAILRLLERDDQSDGIVETLEEIKWISPDGTPFDPPQRLLQQFRTHIFDRWYFSISYPKYNQSLALSEARLVKSLLIKYEWNYGTRSRTNSSTMIQIQFQLPPHYQYISHLHLILHEGFWKSESGPDSLYLPNLEECSIIRERIIRERLDRRPPTAVGDFSSDQLLRVLKAKNLRELSLYDECRALRECLIFILPTEFPRLRSLSLSEERDSSFILGNDVLRGYNERHSLRLTSDPFEFLGFRRCLQVPTIHELYLDISDTYRKGTWETFMRDIVSVAANAKRLRLNDSSSALDSRYNQYILSRFPNLEELEFKGKISRQEWIDDSQFVTLPKLRCVTVYWDTAVIQGGNKFPKVRILPFNIPNLEEFTLDSPRLSETRHIQTNISSFIVNATHSNPSYPTSLRFTDPYFFFDFSRSSQEGTLENLTTLQCSLETAASLIPFIPNLTSLAIVLDSMPTRLLPRKQDKKCKNFLKGLARSTTLASIAFGGWGPQEKDFDIFLSEKKRILVEQRKKLPNSTSFAESLRHISIPGYPDWTVLLDVLRLLHDNDPNSQIQSVKLPGLPHPSILVTITNALKGRFTDQASTTNLERVLMKKNVKGCSLCLASGWNCVAYRRNTDDWTLTAPCGRHSLNHLVEINSYTSSAVSFQYEVHEDECS